jgi:hypothetical protein
MIRHIVLWKLVAETAEGKAASAAELARILEPLAGVIPGIASLTVRPNAAFAEVNWDVALVGDFESLAALEAYQVHPEHVAVTEVVREHVTARAAVDFDL